MALIPSASFVVSSILSLLTFSGMQMAKPYLVASRLSTIFGGFLGSLFFVFFFTAVGNLEIVLFGKGHVTRLGETIFSLLVSVIISGTIHRVSATSCILFSLAMLLSMYKISQDTYNHVQETSHEKSSKRKK
ncbi:Protein KRTCAP2 homolog [Lepeophtheirus salmonis]|uniref:Keratinocyteassociated protein 2 [Bombyx mori] n=1 Tax=Lepeophtheirus salmonis TaxID=72036 RepID=A0A0K2UA32_LEPSM|nr:protein KRTCAP2 homolog [Lepeophtheirus salmonis]CAB4070061.1 Protein KRTCAP2 homolog [Lepeophtheirus salmonis]CAF3039031.1 Protein KRTCAP2 homolog [Lepeophtheirus salmonis]